MGHAAGSQKTVEQAMTTHEGLSAWVAEVAALTLPERVSWVDGSVAEYGRLTDQLVAEGTFTRLNEDLFPHSFAAFSDPKDVARVEDRTFICSENERDAGFTNNWMDPAAMRDILNDKFAGSMRGRTMYVIPFVMGSLDAENPKFGVEITDSAYVVASMRIMACNALLGKKCFALRIASVMARDEGWLAEHMLILKLTSPEGKNYHIAGAFPSACGKTNLALIEPTIPGWTTETLGDDINWMRFGKDGELRAVNPEAGLFGVAPGTGWGTNPNAMAAIVKGNSIFTNVALTDDGGVWWEGMTEEVPAHLTDWQGNSWEPGSERTAAHPNARFCTPIDQVDMLSKDYFDPAGVEINAILFGGRRKTTIPLVTQARDWTHGIFMGSTLSSETTAAATGAVGVVRRDPMAMLPFIGYDAGDYLKHWIDLSADANQDRLPKIFLVNWFRRTASGGFAWPGFSENSRVLKWVIERIEGKAEAVETPIGFVPAPGSLDLDGLDLTDSDLADALRVVPGEWEKELAGIEEWYARFGSSLPEEMAAELSSLKARFAG